MPSDAYGKGAIPGQDKLAPSAYKDYAYAVAKTLKAKFTCKHHDI